MIGAEAKGTVPTTEAGGKPEAEDVGTIPHDMSNDAKKIDSE